MDSSATPAQANVLEPVIEQATEHIDSASEQELAAAVGLPLLAVAIGLLCGRWLARKWHGKTADIIRPLLLPMLGLLLTGLAFAAFKGLGLSPVVLPFVSKLMLAWLAMRAVFMMTSREMAGWFVALVIVPITSLHLLGLWDPLVGLMQSVEFSLGKVNLNLYMVLKAVVGIVAMFWLTGFIAKTVDRRLKRLRGLHANNRALIVKIAQVVLYFVLFLVIMQIVGIDPTALTVFGGALGVALGFGLQKTASNFVSGMILLFEKSIEVGDVIELQDGTMGNVRRTSTRYTLLEMHDGKEILIPNEEFIIQRVTNWTLSHSKGRIDIFVPLPFDADLEKARMLMLAAAKNHPKCLSAPLPICVVNRFVEGMVELQLVFWIGDMHEGRLEVKGEVSLAIWHALRENDMRLGHPQRGWWEHGA